MFEEFLKSDGGFSASDKQRDNSKVNTAFTAFTATNTTATATATAAVNKDIQMEDVSSPPNEATTTETSPPYPAHVWEEIRLNLDEAYHCIETANHWAKNHSDLQRMMHEIMH